MAVPGACMNIINARHIKDGYGTLANPERFMDQDYQQLKQYCLIRNIRFRDDMFPLDKSSIGPTILKERPDLEQVEWKRPREIVPNPSLIVDGISYFDFGQGSVGDCWVLASIGALTFKDHILAQVVPDDQSFGEDYCGLFHFRFWRFGKWVDVIIDDKLPTIKGRLVFVHSKDPTEFWPALLEKAYAKVCGSYSDMISGTPSEALVDFTGGVHMNINLQSPPSNLWELMTRAGQCLMCCGTKEDTKGIAVDHVFPNGLVEAHAYAVTGVRELKSQGQMVKLVRLWNPWGKREWNGDWSDESRLWDTVSPEERKICLAVADNGEFWMLLEDFCDQYSSLDICSTGTDFLDGSSTGDWRRSMYEGRWVAGTTAGGHCGNTESFWTNPQYRVKIGQKSEKHQDEKNMLVSLMQKPDKRNRRLVQNLYIGFTVFEIPDAYKGVVGKFPASFFSLKTVVARTQAYLNAREVMALVYLDPGEYVIVPATYNPNETASFLLTVLSKAKTHVYESSDGHNRLEIKENLQAENGLDIDIKRTFFRQYSDKYEEVNAEQLQSLLNQNILKGDLKSGGFSLDACRSMVALMDTSITGKLNSEEFVRLWSKITSYKDIFFRTDVSRTGTLSLNELRNAIMAIGMRVGDEMLNLMALRYGASSGHMTLENFISLVLRCECMNKIFKQLSDGKTLSLGESEWMCISMYT